MIGSMSVIRFRTRASPSIDREHLTCSAFVPRGARVHCTRSRSANSLATPLGSRATAANISKAIRQRFAQSPDAGVMKRLAKVALDPPNPFNPNARRQPRQEAVILGALILIALALVFYFNITSAAG